MKNLSKSVKRIAGLLVALLVASSFAAATPAQAAGSRTLTIHLHRSHLSDAQTHANGYCAADPCDIYDGINLWTWDMGDGNSTGPGVLFDQTDDYGVSVQLDVTAAPAKNLGGFITRLGGNWGNAWTKEDVNPVAGTNGDRHITLNATGDTEVWIKQGDPGVYTYNPLTVRYVNVHYTRADGNFTGWNVYNWIGSEAATVADFSSSDCYGKVATIMIPDSVSDSSINYIVRKSVTGNDWSLQTDDLSATLTSIPLASTDPSIASRTSDVWLVDNTATGGTETVLGNGHLDYGTPTTGARSALKVHYYRDAGDYTGWNIWHFGGSNSAGAQGDFIGTDSYGKFACVQYPTDTPALTEYSILFRSTNDWATAVKDTAPGETGMSAGNRVITLAADGQTEVWFKQGKNYVYTAEPELEAPQKSLQTVKAIVSKLKKGKTAALPAKSSRNLVITWTSFTPSICSVASGKVKGLKVGACKLSAIQRGNTLVQAVTARRSITITK